ncbi:hypothetical protein IX51_09580 [uncultured archaeon]|nr:hypothetical protein IX51_09580 [uncultured archaeon]
MLLYLYIIPTLILVVSFLIYNISGKGFKDYISRLESKVKTIEKLSNMVFTKNMLSMFLRNSSLNTQLFFSEREIAEEMGEETKPDDMPMMSMKDMEKLESSLKNALQPSRDLERVKHDSSMIRKLMIIYGVMIAITEYVLVTATQFAFTDSIIFQLDGIVFGITIIFSAVLLLILVDLFTTARKINNAFENVEYNYSKHRQSTLSVE